MCMYVYVCVCVFVNVCMHVCVYIYMGTYVCSRYVCLSLCVRARVLLFLFRGPDFVVLIKLKIKERKDRVRLKNVLSGIR